MDAASEDMQQLERTGACAQKRIGEQKKLANRVFGQSAPGAVIWGISGWLCFLILLLRPKNGAGGW